MAVKLHWRNVTALNGNRTLCGKLANTVWAQDIAFTRERFDDQLDSVCPDCRDHWDVDNWRRIITHT